MFHVEQSDPSKTRGLSPPEALRLICLRNGLALSDAQISLLARYVEALLEWNSKVNLISRRDQENVWFSHILHSLALLFYVELPDSARVLDLGTGGGLPGIPIAIARPGLEIVLLDSIRKKTTAVQEMVDRLGLTGVSVRTGRAEEIQPGREGIGTFDIVVARAVASLRDLARWSRPCLNVPGPIPAQIPDGKRIRLTSPVLVALKGGDLAAELEEARIKEGVKSIRVIQMSFDGALELGLEDKKAVVLSL
jgi:16S rRNA (guanine527-N7)-methyltransferase